MPGHALCWTGAQSDYHRMKEEIDLVYITSRSQCIVSLLDYISSELYRFRKAISFPCSRLLNTLEYKIKSNLNNISLNFFKTRFTHHNTYRIANDWTSCSKHNTLDEHVGQTGHETSNISNETRLPWWRGINGTGAASTGGHIAMNATQVHTNQFIHLISF